MHSDMNTKDKLNIISGMLSESETLIASVGGHIVPARNGDFISNAFSTMTTQEWGNSNQPYCDRQTVHPEHENCNRQEIQEDIEEGVTMASTKEYLEYILEQLSGLNDVTYRAMMGEYIIYYRGKVVGGIYDDRFLVKPVKAAAALMPDAEQEIPYEGAKAMLLVDDVENREFLYELLEAMYDELPAPK